MTNVNGSNTEKGSYNLASIYTRSTEDVTNVEDHNLEGLNYDKLVQSDNEELISKERFHNDGLSQSEYEHDNEELISKERFDNDELSQNEYEKQSSREKDDDIKYLNIKLYDKKHHKIVKESKGKSRRREEKHYGKGKSLYREVSPKTQQRLVKADLLQMRNKTTKNYEEVDKKFYGEQSRKSKFRRDEISESNSSVDSQNENVSNGEQDKKGTISEFEYIIKSVKRLKKNKTKKHKEKILQQDENTTASFNNITHHTKEKYDTGDDTTSYVTKKSHHNAKLEQSMTLSGKSESNTSSDSDFAKVDKENVELVKRFVEQNEEEEKASNSYLDDYYEEPLPHHVIGRQEYYNRSSKENQPKQVEPGVGLWKENRKSLRRDDNLLEKQEKPRIPQGDSKRKNKFENLPQNKDSSKNYQNKTKLSKDSNKNASIKENQSNLVEPGFGLWNENRTPLSRDDNLLEKQEQPRIPKGDSKPTNKFEYLPQNKDSSKNYQNKTKLSKDSDKNTSSKENQLKQVEPGFGLWKENRTPLRRHDNLLEKQEKTRIPKGDPKPKKKFEHLPQNKDSSKNNQNKTKLFKESNKILNESNSDKNISMSFDIDSFRDYIKKELNKSRLDLPHKDDTSTQGENKSDTLNHSKIEDKLSELKFKGKSTYKSKSDWQDDRVMTQNKNDKSNNEFANPLTKKGLQGVQSEYKSTSGRRDEGIMSQNKNDKLSNDKRFKEKTKEDQYKSEYKATSGRHDKTNMSQSKNEKLKVPLNHKGLKGASLDKNANKTCSNEPEKNGPKNSNAKNEENEPYYKQFLNKNKKQEKILKRLGNPKLIIVGREKWDEKMKNSQKKGDKKNLKMVTHVTYTHTQSKNCENESECIDIVRNLLKWNLESGKPDIHYNFLVGGDACIYEGSGWPKMNTANEPSGFDIRQKGLHSYSGSSAISIAFIGRYIDERPPPQMLSAAYVFVNDSMDRKFINRNFSYSRLV